MVKLNKIYTRTGDDGKTSLVGGGRVSKHAKRPAAYGEVDELNSVLGMARLQCGADTTNHNMDNQFARIQNDLFDLGADLATVDDMKPALRITAAQVTRLEQEIDEINDNLSALNSFILPGGTTLAAWLHLARTVARRAERQMTELATVEPVNEHAMQYINRLSDLLFVLARHANDGGKSDILWVPGGTQEADKG
jgi:cob(I)alamin adenosyltransferase